MSQAGGSGSVAGAVVRAPRGTALSCKGWEQEAALRMLMNSRDLEVAERREELATGRDFEGFRATVEALRGLESDETLLVASGRPTGLLRAGSRAPRVVIEMDGFAAYGGIAADSWLFVGAQTGLPVAYEALAAAAREHFGGTLAGRLVVACGMGLTGGPLPLAATLNGAAFLGIEADAEQIKRRVKTGYCEVMVNDLDEALRILKNSVRKREAASVGLIGNCAEVLAELGRRGIVPDLLVDCTLADGLSADYLELLRLGSRVFRFGGGGECAGARAPGIPDFTAEFVRPIVSGGRGLALWAALSGEPADIAAADRAALELFAGDEAAAQWIRLAGKHVQFQGVPARVCLVDAALRAKFGLAVNDLVAHGKLKAPVVIGCAGFEGGETDEGSADAPGRGAIEALLARMHPAARAASWVGMDSGGRRNAQGNRWERAVVADGTAEMALRIELALSRE